MGLARIGLPVPIFLPLRVLAPGLISTPVQLVGASLKAVMPLTPPSDSHPGADRLWA
jgi:hypothetical protein